MVNHFGKTNIIEVTIVLEFAVYTRAIMVIFYKYILNHMYRCHGKAKWLFINVFYAVETTKTFNFLDDKDIIKFNHVFI